MSNDIKPRKLSKNITGTYSVSLPAVDVQNLNWRRGQKLIVIRQGNKLIVKDWK